MEFSATRWLGIARSRPSRHRTSAAKGGANVEVRPCPDEYNVMTASGLTPLGRRGHRLLLERQRSSASILSNRGQGKGGSRFRSGTKEGISMPAPSRGTRNSHHFIGTGVLAAQLGAGKKVSGFPQAVLHGIRAVHRVVGQVRAELSAQRARIRL